jgi:hypothetical protein
LVPDHGKTDGQGGGEDEQGGEEGFEVESFHGWPVFRL